MNKLIRRLEDRGHTVFQISKSLVELGNQVSRVAKEVEASEATPGSCVGSRQALPGSPSERSRRWPCLGAVKDCRWQQRT